MFLGIAHFKQLVRELSGGSSTKCRYATDFGQGFYVTNNVKQAEEWAIRKSKELKMLEVSNDISPVVIYFLLDYKKLEKLNGKDFSKATTQWGQFVLDCRLSGMNEQRFHEHDYVFGPLADGKLIPLLKRYKSGTIDNNTFIEGIMPLSKVHHQLSLNSIEAYNCLELLEVKEIGS